MRYETAKAFRTALEQRLKNEAQASDIALIRLRKGVAFERFLARLATSESSGWVLKGAFALELRLGLRARTTKDIDLGRADDEEAATAHLNAATDIDLGDFFVFEVRRTPALDAATGFHAVRYTVRADLDGRRFEQFPVDVAFSEAMPIQAEPLFRRELAAVRRRRRAAAAGHLARAARCREAPRLHRRLRTKPAGEHPCQGSRRPRSDWRADRARRQERPPCARTTFEQRARQPLPSAIPSPPSSWARPYAVLAREVGLASDIETGHAAAARLLDPVLRSEAGGHWDPEAQRWRSRT